jgi:TRAP-type C4-dicarboxylate transport system permease small subunit
MKFTNSIIYLKNIITYWALIGGGLLLFLLLINVFGVAFDNITQSVPYTPYELIQFLMPVVIFNFLPYCEMRSAHITFDYFIERFEKRGILLLSIIKSTIVILISTYILHQMIYGMIDYYSFGYETVIMSIPIWLSYPPILTSLFLLILAAIINIKEEIS